MRKFFGGEAKRNRLGRFYFAIKIIPLVLVAFFSGMSRAEGVVGAEEGASTAIPVELSVQEHYYRDFEGRDKPVKIDPHRVRVPVKEIMEAAVSQWRTRLGKKYGVKKAKVDVSVTGRTRGVTYYEKGGSIWGITRYPGASIFVDIGISSDGKTLLKKNFSGDIFPLSRFYDRNAYKQPRDAPFFDAMRSSGFIPFVLDPDFYGDFKSFVVALAGIRAACHPIDVFPKAIIFAKMQGEASLNDALKALLVSDETVDTTVEIIDVLVTDDRGLEDALIPLLRKEIKSKKKVIGILDRMHSKSAGKDLIHVLKNDEDVQCRIKASQVLGELGGDEAIGPLVATLISTHDRDLSEATKRSLQHLSGKSFKSKKEWKDWGEEATGEAIRKYRNKKDTSNFWGGMGLLLIILLLIFLKSEG